MWKRCELILTKIDGNVYFICFTFVSPLPNTVTELPTKKWEK